MAEATKNRRWPRRLLLLAVLVVAVAVFRARQFARNEQRYSAAPTPG
jgi:hypothetical protein